MTSSYFVLINGSPHGYLSHGRGLRQGILYPPTFSSLLLRFWEEIFRSTQILIFLKVSKLLLLYLLHLINSLFMTPLYLEKPLLWKENLNGYAMISGQDINYDKSKIYFFHITPTLQHKIFNILGCNFASLSDSYLALLIIFKNSSSGFWNYIVERVEKKLAGQKGNLSSQARKLQLLKA